MNRREMLKLGSAASVSTLASTASAERSTATTKVVRHQPVRQWEIFELALAGAATGNPFIDIQFEAVFSLGYRSLRVPGFYDANGVYKVRFMPDTLGQWSYTTSSSAPELTGKTGTFACTTALPEAHGPVRVRNTHHFAYADGTPFFPFGTTCYAWVHQTTQLQEQTLRTLKANPFNKIRMCVFPKSYEYNHNEPPLYPFERDATGKSDFSRPNPAYFAHIEQRISDLRNLGIEADLILFHPYDRWGYANMGADADDRYLRYVLARMSAHRNIWWSLANEFDLMRAKSVQDFDRFFQIVEQEDPAGHLRSVHFSHVMYDYSRPWVTHASLQSYDFEAGPRWAAEWKKPVVYDEVMYEGNLNSRWGNLSGDEMTRRFWLGVIGGCYVTHGETFLNPDQPLDEYATPVIWWSHGGTLHGTSPPRIAFLRELVEESAAFVGKDAKRTGFDAEVSSYYLNASTVDASGRATSEILYFMDFHSPVFYDFPLPQGTYTAELIDPIAMKVTPLTGTYSGKTRLKLSGRPYQALLFRKADT